MKNPGRLSESWENDQLNQFNILKSGYQGWSRLLHTLYQNMWHNFFSIWLTQRFKSQLFKIKKAPV